MELGNSLELLIFIFLCCLKKKKFFFFPSSMEKGALLFSHLTCVNSTRENALWRPVAQAVSVQFSSVAQSCLTL